MPAVRYLPGVSTALLNIVCRAPTFDAIVASNMPRLSRCGMTCASTVMQNRSTECHVIEIIAVEDALETNGRALHGHLLFEVYWRATPSRKAPRRPKLVDYG